MEAVGWYEVRPRDREGFGIFVRLCEEYFRESFSDMLTSDWPKSYTRSLRKRYRQGKRRFLVCTVSGQPAGLANIYVEGKTGHVAEFYVRPAYRRKGVGRRLFEHCRGLLSAMGAGKVEIGVQTDRPGRAAFWKSVGFETVRLRMSRPIG